MVLLAIVLVPFWTSLMVRNFAWVVLLQEDGPIKGMLRALGGDDIQLLGNITGVVIGEIQILLPFVILPLYARLRTIDRRLLDAAGSLGATPRRGFFKVYLPLSVPGLLSGGVLAFVLSLGFYVTPMLLGSSREQLLSPLMVTQVNQLLALGRGGAMAAVLLIVSLLLIGAVFLATRKKAVASEGAFVEPRGEPAERSRHRVLSPVVGVVALILVLPALIVIPMSFTGPKTFSFPPRAWSTKWWGQLFSNPEWLHALINSLTLGARRVRPRHSARHTRRPWNEPRQPSGRPPCERVVPGAVGRTRSRCRHRHLRGVPALAPHRHVRRIPARTHRTCGPLCPGTRDGGITRIRPATRVRRGESGSRTDIDLPVGDAATDRAQRDHRWAVCVRDVAGRDGGVDLPRQSHISHTARSDFHQRQQRR